MAINPKLLLELEKKTGLGRRQVNRLIGKEASNRTLPRNLAAISLAGQHGIPIHRFASNSELAELRGSAQLNHAAAQVEIPVAQTVRRTAKAKSAKANPPVSARNNVMFVVHGRDSQLTADMYAFLRAIGIEPMEWNHAIKAAKGGANPNVGDVIHDAMKKVQGVMVLFSPDEKAQLKAPFVSETDKRKNLHKLEGQARPNVIFEAGLALGAHSAKTILVQVGHVREISDIAGKHMLHLSNAPADRKALALRLKDKLKFKVDLTGDDWLNVGNFDRR